MRRRLTEPVSPRGDTEPSKVRVVKVDGAVSLVTLDTPGEPPQEARGAFCRLNPPPGLSDDEIDSWRDSVAKVAIAVKVVRGPKTAHVPNESRRVSEGEKIGTFRDEATKLARETKNPFVISSTNEILDEVGL